MAADITVRQRIDVEFDMTFELVDVWLVSNIADGATYRTRTKQRPLWSAQRFDTIQIVQIEVRCKQGQRND